MALGLPNTKYAKKRIPLETEIQRNIIDYLKLNNIFHFRVNTMGVMRKGRYCPSPTTTKGVADIIAICPPEDKDHPYEGNVGQLCAIEVKRLGGKQSPDQKKFQKAVEDAGGLYLLCYSVNDVRAGLGL